MYNTSFSSEYNDRVFDDNYLINCIESASLKELDTYFYDAGIYTIERDKASIGMIQRVFKIGFNRADRIINQLSELNVIGEENGTAPRKINMNVSDFRRLVELIDSNQYAFKSDTNETVLIPEINVNKDYDNMDGHQFENYCSFILLNNGFEKAEVTQASGDHGIDILAEKDGITYAIQCKCYSSNIGNSAVQQAHTGKSLYKKDIAVVMTNRYFTQQAIDEANELGVKLWDRDKLNSMIN